MRKFFKYSVIVLMLILFCVCISNMFYPRVEHEIIGCIFMWTTAVHNIFNKNFYIHSLTETKLTKRLVMNVLCMFLFAVFFGATIFSGMAISQNHFAEFIVPDIIDWKAVHKVSAVSILVVIAIHLRCSIGGVK